jgi:hypothetical protein
MQQKKFYWKRRLVSEIYGPTILEEIIALNDDANIQVTDFQKINWTWLNDFFRKKKELE